MISGRQCRIGVVTALVIVVFDIKAAQLRILDTECAARVVNVLTI